MTLEVGGPVYGGGFALPGQPGVVVQGVLPGERLAEPPRLEPAQPGHAHEMVAPAVVQPSLLRVLPGCAHFGACGGCHYQQAGAETQLGWKWTILAGLLAELPGVPEIETHAAEPWGYRNRIRLRVERVDGTVRLGYSRRASRDFLPVSMCPIAQPLLWRAAESLLEVAAADAATARWLGSCAEMELSAGLAADASPSVQALFLMREAAPASQAVFKRLYQGLAARLPELAGAGAVPRPEAGRRERRGWQGFAWGRTGLLQHVDGRDYWVSRGSFFQVNRFLLETLVGLVVPESAGEGAAAWDLFAGVGLFTRALAARGWAVVAVEGAPAAARDLAGASARFGYQAVEASAQAFVAAQRTQRERPQLVVADPPRAGLGEAAGSLAAIGAARLVYVSCDPVSLVRDLRILMAGGYRLASVHLVDLFPQTFHIETVVELEYGQGR